MFVSIGMVNVFPVSVKRRVAKFLNWILGRVLGRYCEGVLIRDVDGDYFLSSLKDLGVGGRLRYQGSYGTDDVRFIHSICDGFSSVLVVGAHIGAVALKLARLGHIVTAVEANPESFRLLVMNCKLNNVDNVEVINACVGDKSERIQFVVNSINSGGSKIAPVMYSEKYFYDSPDILNLITERLDDLFIDRSFDAVVMDIEGAEYKAVCGAECLLRHCKYLFVEFVPHHISEVAGLSFDEWFSIVVGEIAGMLIPDNHGTVKKLSGSQAKAFLRSAFERRVVIDLICVCRSS